MILNDDFFLKISDNSATNAQKKILFTHNHIFYFNCTFLLKLFNELNEYAKMLNRTNRIKFFSCVFNIFSRNVSVVVVIVARMR